MGVTLKTKGLYNVFEYLTSTSMVKHATIWYNIKEDSLFMVDGDDTSFEKDFDDVFIHNLKDNYTDYNKVLYMFATLEDSGAFKDVEFKKNYINAINKLNTLSILGLVNKINECLMGNY